MSPLAQQLQADVARIQWHELTALANFGGFGELHMAQLFCSGAQAVTASHYDLNQNFFLQLRGAKRFVLFPPLVGARAFAPFPVGHPRDRCAVLRLDRPDYREFPFAQHAHGAAVEAVVEPGDCLFLPLGWWHHVESLAPENVSLNFWYEGGDLQRRPPERVLRPLPEATLLELSRELELALGEAVNYGLLPAFLQWMLAPEALLTRALPPHGEQLRWLRCANFALLRAAQLVRPGLLRQWLEILEPRRFLHLHFRKSASVVNLTRRSGRGSRATGFCCHSGCRRAAWRADRLRQRCGASPGQRGA
mmetsp:Transcript_63628/g.197169  ORF Transcript_63628/g.197169 Transcript_63628/m.197169 type:complete len:306 (-) Transcript_63628:7-924(-)